MLRCNRPSRRAAPLQLAGYHHAFDVRLQTDCWFPKAAQGVYLFMDVSTYEPGWERVPRQLKPQWMPN